MLDISSIVGFINTNFSEKLAASIIGIQAVQVLLDCLDPDDGSSKGL
jgi:hypothetical protein